MEIWKDIPGYESTYYASNLGRIKSVLKLKKKESIVKNGGEIKEKILSQEFTHDYFRITLCNNLGHKRFQVHRLILMSFERLPLPSEECNHLDSNTKNNNLNNLEWVTPEENVKHRILSGKYLTQSGENQYNSKLKTNEVLEIRDLYKNGKSKIDIANIYNTTASNILNICKGKSWKHLPL